MKDRGITEKLTQKGDSKGIVLSFVLVALLFMQNLLVLPSIYSSALCYSICILMPFVLTYLVEHKDKKSLGLRVFRLKESAILAVALSTINGLGMYLTLRLCGVQFSPASLNAPMVLGLLSVYFNPGFVEELPFRGYMQTRFQNRYGFHGVIFVTILFALFHLPKVVIGLGMGFVSGCIEILVVMIGSFAISYVYWKTSSLVSAIL